MDLKENAKVGIVAGSKSDQETGGNTTSSLHTAPRMRPRSMLAKPPGEASRSSSVSQASLQPSRACSQGTRFFRSLACPAPAARSTASMHCTPLCRCPRESRWPRSASATARMPVTSPPTSSPSQIRLSAKSSSLTARASGISKAKPFIPI